MVCAAEGGGAGDDHPHPAAAPPVPASEIDRRLMRAAFGLARRHAGRAWPNPSVGALVVRFDKGQPRIVGRGTTAAGGRPHAEVVALAEAGEAARGATVYVTLEPCSHFGRTPPCADALVRAGVERVVTGIEDPDPRVAGRGHERLSAHGIGVTAGVLAEEAARLHAGHIRRVRDGRPHVALKLAVSADGCIGRRGAGQVAISGPLAKAYALAMRAEHDAIMVGIGTVLEDDPELTCRLPGLAGLSPVRVVLDARGEMPLTSRIAASARTVPTWLMVGDGLSTDRRHALEAAGFRLVTTALAGGRIDVRAALIALGEAGITTVISEGGARIARALVEAGLVDEVRMVRSSVEVGQGGVPALAGLPLDLFDDRQKFRTIQRRALGADRLTVYWRMEGP